MMCSLWQDVTDLFGTDLPVEGGKGGEFAWRDGPLLAALKAGHWVVLDEVRTIVQTLYSFLQQFYGVEPVWFANLRKTNCNLMMLI